MRKSNFEGLKSQFRNFFRTIVCTFAIDSHVRNVAKVRTKIADARHWLCKYCSINQSPVNSSFLCFLVPVPSFPYFFPPVGHRAFPLPFFTFFISRGGGRGEHGIVQLNGIYSFCPAEITVISQSSSSFSSIEFFSLFLYHRRLYQRDLLLSLVLEEGQQTSQEGNLVPKPA